MADGRWRRRHLSGRRCVLVAAALIFAACSDPSATTTAADVAVSTAPPPSPTTSSTTAGTEPTAAGPVDICGRGTIWESGVTHVAPCFLDPLMITAPGEGWRTSRATLEAIEGLWVPATQREPAIRYVILAYQPDRLPRASLESILAIDGVHASGSPFDSPDRSWVDVETDPVPTFGPEFECVWRVAWALRWHGGEGEPGYALLDLNRAALGAPATYGLGACRLFRIWALSVSDITITVIATTDDLDRFDELMPMMQRLVDTITVATP